MSDPLHSDEPDPNDRPKPHLWSVPPRLCDVVTELKQLRRGRGVLTSRVDSQIGPVVRALARVGHDDGPAEIRGKVAQWLSRLADDLPADDLRAAALTAFAVAPDARQPLYKDRVDLVAKRIERDARTARRRIDEAIEQLAQLATARPGYARLVPGGPTVAELRLSLALDRPQPELVEHCRFTAEQDGVEEVTLFTHRLAGFAELTAEQLTTDVLYGGTLVPHRTDQGQPVLRLARPLCAGESHEYVVRSVVRRPELLPSRLCLPGDHRCAMVELHVRFGRDRLPTSVEPIGDGSATAGPDGAGDVLASFAGLPPGRVHGLRWD